MVPTAHIDALIEAGLYAAEHSHCRFSWYVRSLDNEEKRDAYQAGEPWGPGAGEIGDLLRRELNHATADRVGQMLLRENRLSVDHRYNESELEPIYHFEHWTSVTRVDPVVILKALSCYEYQSCEHPGWETSEAKTFCDRLQSEMIRLLPGYEDAAGWSIEKRSDYLADAPALSLLKTVQERQAKKPGRPYQGGLF